MCSCWMNRLDEEYWFLQLGEAALCIQVLSLKQGVLLVAVAVF